MPTLCKMLDVCKAEHLNTQESWQKEIAGLCNLVVVTIKRCKAEMVKSKSNHDSSLPPRWSLEYGDSKQKML